MGYIKDLPRGSVMVRSMSQCQFEFRDGHCKMYRATGPLMATGQEWTRT